MAEKKNTLAPKDANQVAEAVEWALANETPLEILSGGSKRALGRPATADHRLELSALSRLTDYQPEELVLTAEAGIRLKDLQETLTQKSQHLGFEPPDLGPLLGSEAGKATLGGVIASGLSGPRRIQAGAVRDHVLGFEGVSGRAEAFKSGGRMVKNVTGFDLSKLMAGSFGTLGVLTTVHLRALPMPEKTRTVLVSMNDWSNGIQALSEGLKSSCEVSAAAFLPGVVAKRSRVSYIKEAGSDVAALRLEGPGPSVKERARTLRNLLGPMGDVEELHSRNSELFWREIRDVSYYVSDQAKQVWRVSIPPTAAPGVVDAILANVDGEAFADWGGGLIWLAMTAEDDAAENVVRNAIEKIGGHATLIRAEEKVRGGADVFQPQPDALATVTKRIKEGFDPKGILNPERMYAGV